MSNQALDLLIDCELLKSNGRIIDIYKIPRNELSRRFLYFTQARQESIHAELDAHPTDSKLNAQFSTWPSQYSKEKTLSALLVYNRIILNDPLVSSHSSISMDGLHKGLQFYSWLHPLIRSGFVNVYPINYYNNPSQDIPLLRSEDAFKSSISPKIHDYAHKNAILKSAISPGVKFLNLNERFLNIESPNTIIELRNKYSTAFERFNSTLISASEELHGIETEEFDRKCKTLFQNEIMPQVDEVRSAIGQISSGLLKGTFTSLSSVGIAISTGSTIALVPALIATATMALSETIPTLRELQLKKQRPGYIWHRLTM